MKWFEGISTLSEAKARYNELARQYHPDREGGNSNIMSEINLEYKDLQIALRLLPELVKDGKKFRKFRAKISKEYKENVINSSADAVGNLVKIGLETVFDKFFVTK